jgi:hypothetical protein
MKKNFLLRIEEDTFSLVEKLSKEEDRSINYTLCKLVDRGLEANTRIDNAISLKSKTIKDLEKIASKSNKTKEVVLESMLEAYIKTFK